MMEVGAYEAKTHLPRLLDKVAKGERIVIKKHGVPVAVLSPVIPKTKESIENTVDDIIKFRKGRKLGKMSLRELIEHGRR